MGACPGYDGACRIIQAFELFSVNNSLDSTSSQFPRARKTQLSQGIQGKGLQHFYSDIALSAAIFIFSNTVCVTTLA